MKLVSYKRILLNLIHPQNQLLSDIFQFWVLENGY